MQMENLKKLLLLVLLAGWCLGGNAQEKGKVKFTFSEEFFSKVCFLYKGEVIWKGKPHVPKGDSVVVTVEWNPKHFEKIIVDSLRVPTKEELQNCKYRRVILPEKTTSYRVTHYFLDKKTKGFSEKVVVVDKEGKEIIEVKKENMSNLK